MRRLVPALRAAAGPRSVHLDVGGEGRWAGAVNVNLGRMRSTTAPAGAPIPRLIVGPAGRLPIASGAAHLVTLENAPITDAIAGELARVVRPGGHVVLHGPAAWASSGPHEAVRAALRGSTMVLRHEADEMLLTVLRAAAPGW